MEICNDMEEASMKTRTLVAALVAAGVIGVGAGAAWHDQIPFNSANAQPVMAAGVATPAANPGVTSLPLTGFTELVKDYGPAVVNISVSGTQKTAASVEIPDMPGLDEDNPLRDFFRNFRGQIPRGNVPIRGLGSGFIVSPDGYILTNAHVVANADEVWVRLTDRREFKAKVIGADKQSDIAVIRIDARNLPTVKIGSSKSVNPGEWVAAIGSPFGFENSVSAGIVSAKSRSLPDANYVPFIQTDVAVNPGNSGGPLFNLAGEVVGINSQIYSRSGGYQGISFAIPIEVAMNVKDQLVKHGKVTRGRLGVSIQEVNASLAQSFGLDRPRGALVASVDSGGPAEKAGIEVGDIILRYDGQPIDRSADLPLLVANTAPGSRADVEVWRKGSTKRLSVAAAENRSERTAANDESAGKPSGRLGLAVRPLTPEERRENHGRGALIVEDVGGPAERAGVQPGDVVLSMNGTPVKSAEELRDLVGKAGKHVALLIERDGRQLFVPVELG
jgi:serine protease Do